MKTEFDILIIGRNIKSSIQLKKEADNKKRVAYINDTDKNLKAEYIKVFTYKSLIDPFAAITQNKIIKVLKRKAAHLMLTTIIEEYKRLSFFDKIMIKLNNLLFKHQITVSKCLNNKKSYKLTYKSYKFSINRCINSIIKSTNKNTYTQIDNSTTIEAKKTFDYNKKTHNNSIVNTLWFSYSNDNIELDKTIIVHTENNKILSIIPWFNYIYFALSSKNETKQTKEEVMQIINNQNIKLNIDRAKILNIQSHKIATQKYSSLLYLNKIKGKLIGSDFEFTYNPWLMMEYADTKYDEAKLIQKSSQYFKKLFYKYGTEIDKITYQAYEYWNELKDIEKTWLKAEIWYLREYENCKSYEEYLHRHTEEWLNHNNINEEFTKQCFSNLK